MKELKVRRAFHHILYVFFGLKKEQYFDMVELLLTISNLGPHTHFIKRRHILKICESKVFYVKFLNIN
jgi:hypothetical protein